MPGELVAAEAREHLDRHVHRDTVVLGARLESVGHRQRQVARLPGVRLVGGGVLVRSRSSRVNVSSSGVRCRCFFHQRVEVPRRDDLGRDAGVVEGVDLVVADDQVAAAGPLFDLFQFLTQPGVVAEESGGGSASRLRRARAG